MNKYIRKEIFIVIDIILIVILINMIYLILNRYLNNDLILPKNITTYEYFRIKLSNII